MAAAQRGDARRSDRADAVQSGTKAYGHHVSASRTTPTSAPIGVSAG
jgi:hypothetical protein